MSQLFGNFRNSAICCDVFMSDVELMANIEIRMCKYEGNGKVRFEINILHNNRFKRVQWPVSSMKI